jgi:hypothetical protein
MNGKPLVIVEESAAVCPEMWDALESLTPARMFSVGAPLRPGGRFAELCNQAASDHKRGAQREEAVTE